MPECNYSILGKSIDWPDREGWWLATGQHLRFRAKREQLERFHGPVPVSQRQNRALTFLYVPNSRDSFKPYTLNPEPETRNPTHQTLIEHPPQSREGLLAPQVKPRTHAPSTEDPGPYSKPNTTTSDLKGFRYL